VRVSSSAGAVCLAILRNDRFSSVDRATGTAVRMFLIFSVATAAATMARMFLVLFATIGTAVAAALRGLVFVMALP
jgi:hypothetical protein